jgi:hypothetical protein
MGFSEIAALPVRMGAAARNRRLFHPDGVLARGSLTRTAAPSEGLPMTSGDVVGRVSKGIGLSGALPDIAGLAWRMPATSQASPPWDVLLASTFRQRLFLAPVSKWSAATFSSLMPLRHRGGQWWVQARLTTHIGQPGLSLDTVRDRIATTGVEFNIEQAAGTGRFRPLARLTLHTLATDTGDPAFDPTVHSHPDVELSPRWLTGFRQAAYRRSREGRDAE